MSVVGIDDIRGRPAYHLVFTLDGGIIGFGVHDRYDSWIDTTTLSSLRYRQQIAEGPYHRTTTYEIYPDRGVYRRNADTLSKGVSNPLDDGSFIYAVRDAGIGVGQTETLDRYFVADCNPVVLRGLSRDTVKVGAGRFATVQVEPAIMHARGIFSDNGDARIWFSDDAHHYPVEVKTKFSHFTVMLTLESVTPGHGA